MLPLQLFERGRTAREVGRHTFFWRRRHSLGRRSKDGAPGLAEGVLRQREEIGARTERTVRHRIERFTSRIEVQKELHLSADHRLRFTLSYHEELASLICLRSITFYEESILPDPAENLRRVVERSREVRPAGLSQIWYYIDSNEIFTGRGCLAWWFHTVAQQTLQLGLPHLCLEGIQQSGIHSLPSWKSTSITVDSAGSRLDTTFASFASVECFHCAQCSQGETYRS